MFQPHNHFVIEQLQLIPGIWVNGKVYWMQNCTEKVIYDEELVIKLKLEHIHSKISFAKIYISNHSKTTKEIKVLVMHHNPNLTGRILRLSHLWRIVFSFCQ